MLQNGAFVYFQEQNSEPNGSTHRVITSVKAVCDSHHRSDISFGSWEVIADHMMPQLKTRYFQPVTVTTTNSLMAYHKFAMFNFVSPADDIDGTVFQYGGIVYTFQDESKPVVFELAKVTSANFIAEANSLKPDNNTSPTGSIQAACKANPLAEVLPTLNSGDVLFLMGDSDLNSGDIHSPKNSLKQSKTKKIQARQEDEWSSWITKVEGEPWRTRYLDTAY